MRISLVRVWVVAFGCSDSESSNDGGGESGADGAGDTMMMTDTGGLPDGTVGGSVIAPDRPHDWGHAGIDGGIPNRTTICATLMPGATAAAINAAIAACPPGQVVLLKAGSYN